MNKTISDKHPKLFGLIISDDKWDLTASHQISGKTIIWKKKKVGQGMCKHFPTKLKIQGSASGMFPSL